MTISTAGARIFFFGSKYWTFEYGIINAARNSRGLRVLSRSINERRRGCKDGTRRLSLNEDDKAACTIVAAPRAVDGEVGFVVKVEEMEVGTAVIEGYKFKDVMRRIE